MDKEKNSMQIQTPINPEVIEMDFSLDKKEIENSNLVRLEMNTIEFPIFTKNKKVKSNTSMKYIFNKEDDRWMSVSPTVNSKIPGELEEKIFYAVMQLYRKNEYKQEVFTDFYTLIKEMGINYSGRSVIDVREGLQVLSKTIYEFNNCFYDNTSRGIKNDNIITTIFSIRIIDLEKEEEISEEYKPYFKNKKIKELIKIIFAKNFYDNIISKGFLRFDSKKLLEMEDGVARTIFLMITKWRNKSLYIKRYSKDIAGKVPLSFEKTNIPYTVNRIKKAINYLKEKELLLDYKFFSGNRLEESYFEIYFMKEHNFDYYTDRSTITGQESLIIKNKEDIIDENILDKKSEPEKISNEEMEKIEKLLKLLPETEKIKKEKWVLKLHELLKKHSYERIEDDIIYSNQNAKEHFEAYFIKSVSQGHWGWGEKEKENGKSKSISDNIKNKQQEEEEAVRLQNEEKEKKEYEKIYEGYEEFEKSQIYLMALDIMEKDGFNMKVSSLVNTLFSSIYKYKAIKEFINKKDRGENNEGNSNS